MSQTYVYIDKSVFTVKKTNTSTMPQSFLIPLLTHHPSLLAVVPILEDQLIRFLYSRLVCIF